MAIKTSGFTLWCSNMSRKIQHQWSLIAGKIRELMGSFSSTPCLITRLKCEPWCWYIFLPTKLGDFWGKCWYIFHTWSISERVFIGIRMTYVANLRCTIIKLAGEYIIRLTKDIMVMSCGICNQTWGTNHEQTGIYIYIYVHNII